MIPQMNLSPYLNQIKEAAREFARISTLRDVTGGAGVANGVGVGNGDAETKQSPQKGAQP